MHRFLNAVAIACVAVTSALVCPTVAADQSADASIGQGRAVLVTGASTGIGRMAAELLAENGFYVYAGARKQEDLDALNAIDNMEGIRLDVTKQDEIDAAVETVAAGGRGLYGLINNAGVGVVGPLIEVDDDHVLFQHNVNVMGPVRVTRAFAPMLIESKGRVSATSSISGFMTWPMGGAYGMTKAALEMYCETLAEEVEPFGVTVSIVEPGGFKSKIGQNMADYLKRRGFTAEGSRYADRLEGLIESLEEEDDGDEPVKVAEAFLHAMTAEDPKFRYMVTPNEDQARRTLAQVVRRLVQLNHDQEYQYSREEMIAMLDEAMGAVGGGDQD